MTPSEPGNDAQWTAYYAAGKPMVLDPEKIPRTKYLDVLFRHCTPQTRALEYCSGRGVDSVLLAKRFGITPTLVDINKKGLELARAFFRKNKVACRIVKSSVYALPFSDGAFDLAYSKGSFSNLEFGEKALSELARVTAPSGVIVVTAVNALRPDNAVFNRRRAYYQRGYLPWELTDTAKRLGLDVVERFGYDSLYVPFIKNPAWSAALLNAPLPSVAKLYVGVVLQKPASKPLK